MYHTFRVILSYFVAFEDKHSVWILSDLNSAGRGCKWDEEEGRARRKEGRGGRNDEEEGATRRKERRGERKK